MVRCFRMCILNREWKKITSSTGDYLLESHYNTPLSLTLQNHVFRRHQVTSNPCIRRSCSAILRRDNLEITWRSPGSVVDHTLLEDVNKHRQKRLKHSPSDSESWCSSDKFQANSSGIFSSIALLTSSFTSAKTRSLASVDALSLGNEHKYWYWYLRSFDSASRRKLSDAPGWFIISVYISGSYVLIRGAYACNNYIRTRDELHTSWPTNFWSCSKLGAPRRVRLFWISLFITPSSWDSMRETISSRTGSDS